MRWSGLNVPVPVHAFPDDMSLMTVADRRDSFCGKMSACNNLVQYGLPFSLTRLHTVDPESASTTVRAAERMLFRRHTPGRKA